MQKLGKRVDDYKWHRTPDYGIKKDPEILRRTQERSRKMLKKDLDAVLGDPKVTIKKPTKDIPGALEFKGEYFTAKKKIDFDPLELKI